MGKMFGGMIIGSLMTMMLLGGPLAADRVLNNGMATFEQTFSQQQPMGNGVLLILLALGLAGLATWRNKDTPQTERTVQKLRRYCS